MRTVPPGQISQNTFEFLTRLKDPACNDRQWCVPIPLHLLSLTPTPRFKLHGTFYSHLHSRVELFILIIASQNLSIDKPKKSGKPLWKSSRVS